MLRLVKRALVAAAGAFALLAYVWVAAVRAVPEVRRRKVAQQAARRQGAPPR